MAKLSAFINQPSALPVSKGQNNRQRIVAAALHLFMERGYAETSIGDVAEHAGILKGNLSYYFKTKADLLAPVCDARQQELFERLQKCLPIDATPLQALEAFIQVTEDSASELARVGCPVGTLASQLGKTDPALQPYASKILASLQSWLAMQFARAMPELEARTNAEFLITLLQGAAVLAHSYQDPAVVQRQTENARQWLRAVLARVNGI